MKALDGFMPHQHKHFETHISEWLVWLFSKGDICWWGKGYQIRDYFELKVWWLNQEIIILVADITLFKR